MTRRERAIELGREIGKANKNNPRGIETLGLLVKQWEKSAVIKRSYNHFRIVHGRCVACSRHDDRQDLEYPGVCGACPFAVFGNSHSHCLSLIAKVGGVADDTGAGFFGKSRVTVCRIKDDIVACLKAAAEAVEDRTVDEAG